MTASVSSSSQPATCSTPTVSNEELRIQERFFLEALEAANKQLVTEKKVRIVAFQQDTEGNWHEPTDSPFRLNSYACCIRIGEETGKKLGAVHIANKSCFMLPTGEIARRILDIKNRHDNIKPTERVTPLGTIYDDSALPANTIRFDPEGFLRVDGLRVFTRLPDHPDSHFLMHAAYYTCQQTLVFTRNQDNSQIYINGGEAKRSIDLETVYRVSPSQICQEGRYRILSPHIAKYQTQEGGKYYELK